MFDKSCSDRLWSRYSEILPLVTVGADQRIKTDGPGARERTGEDCPSGTEEKNLLQVFKVLIKEMIGCSSGLCKFFEATAPVRGKCVKSRSRCTENDE